RKSTIKGVLLMKILVLGGAGYIGSHAVYQLIEQNRDVVVIDNLQTGHREAIHPKATFYEGDLRNIDFLRGVFEKEAIDAVIHFAANSLVGESMEKPLRYFDNNVYGTQVLLQAMNEFNVKHIVFSSTAAVYGEPEHVPITETMPTNPTSTYGETKRTMEKLMHWNEVAHGITYVSLRYFDINVYGTQVLLQAMNEFNVKHIVFSSTAAVYGEPEHVPITETMPTNPTSTYGETKRTMEKLMHWNEVAHGITYVSLRY